MAAVEERFFWFLALLFVGGCGDPSAAPIIGGRPPDAAALDGGGASADADAAPEAAAGDGGDDSGTGTDSEPTNQVEGCNSLTVEFEPQVPLVLLLVDRSGSMFDASYGGYPTRWEALQQALFAPANGVLQRYADDVRFGLMTYTADHQAGQCPQLQDVAPAIDNLTEIRALYERQGMRPAFKAETPTGAAVRAATDALLALDGESPRHILLVTDGNPDDCNTPDPQCGQDESIAAVQEAYAAGIGISVIGISGDVSPQHLRDLANAGRGLAVAPPDMQFVYTCVDPGFASLGARYAEEDEEPGMAPLYQPEDADALGVQLDTLIRGASSCEFELRAVVDLEQAHRGRVLLDGRRLDFEDPDGWSLSDPRRLRLEGSACERVKNASEQLEISFPCEVVDVI